jgi:hypothetical protein
VSIAFEFVKAGLQLYRAGDIIRINCIPEEELGDAIMAGSEEDAMTDDVDDQIQFF